ncbi:MAG: hypothetical protein IPL69_04340 [Saprospiraceae bacterium]|nr:hypothetical protein [Candidatus Brachybacter algidus]
MIFRCIILLTYLLNCEICFSQSKTFELIDKNPTKETKALYNNLQNISKKGYIIGHQDDLAYGVNWRYEEGRSDVKDAVGDYPGLYGWDLAGLELDSKKTSMAFLSKRSKLTSGKDMIEAE